MKITVNFLEPFRMLEWAPSPDRIFTNEVYQRGQTFARWHKDKDKDGKGRPYITGTLLRSAVIRAAENLLVLTNGYADGRKCCPGEFFTKKKDSRLHLRQRANLQWTQEKTCKARGSSPCPLCELLGGFDKATSGIKEKDHFHMHFGNLNLPQKPSYSAPEEIAFGKAQRALNRIDYTTGKAHDFFRVWEIDHIFAPIFEGEITIADGLSDETLSLLKNSLRFVDRLCGSLCTINFDDEIKNANKADVAGKTRKQKDADETANFIAAVITKSGETDRLRVVADAVRELRRGKQMVHRLPLDHEGKKSHYIWDKDDGSRTIRELLTEKTESISVNEWRYFCDQVGEILYQKAKEQTGGLIVSQRILGEAAFWGTPDHDIDPSIASVSPIKETLISGKLRAETPFFFGTNLEEIKQTGLAVLQDHQGQYRLPRSVLRGALRRDLRSVLGRGCNVELGGRPCLCPVCQIMRNITVMDSRSSYADPPEFRKRIRLNPFVGIVAEGALFEMEVAPEGLEFPFRLYYRDHGHLPKELKNVLKWWSEGQAFMGGAVATGKGRFKLVDIKFISFDLLNEEQRKEYLLNRGWRNKLDQLNLADMSLNIEEPREPLWQKVSIHIKLTSPFLNGDPIQALVEGDGADIISFRKYIDKGTRRVYAYKSESLRGVVRAALGRRFEDTDRVNGSKGALLALTHQECDCLLCRIFGSEYEAGKVRFEDLLLKPGESSKSFDHVAIDRFTGGAVDKKKFNDCSLAGSPGHPLVLEGNFWVRADMGKDEKEALANALTDIREGVYPLGGRGGIGYGWVNRLDLGGDEPIVKDIIELMEKESSKGSNLSPPQKANSNLNFQIIERAIHFPHYFLRTADKVDRMRKPKGHQTFHKDLLTGRIKCRLTTLTPLIVPDTEDDNFFELGDKTKEKYYKRYRFFRLNGEIMIPGSELRGMISSVYEALTNSCFRVFNEKRKLSWRMEADKDALKEFLPGMVKKIIEEGKEKFEMIEMQEIRYPFYDKNCPNRRAQEEYFKWGGNGQPYYKHPTPTDQRLLTLAYYNRANAKANTAANYKIIKHRGNPGIDEAFMFVATLSDNMNAYPAKIHGQGVGYLKVTGPNKVEKEKGFDVALLSTPNDREKVIHNRIRLREVSVPCSKDEGEECKKKKLPTVRCGREKDKVCYRMRLVPEFACCEVDEKDPDNSFTYAMTKRCERVFLEIGKQGIPISETAFQNFEILVKEYDRNAQQQQTPAVFRTILPQNGIINDGDLVYFREENGEVIEIIPVRISRKVDSKYLGKRFIHEDLRPCHGDWLEEEDLSLLNGYPEKKLFKRHPEGLCPACRLFGTDSYKGRLRFGFAILEGTAKWLTEGNNPSNGGKVTLPLLESPRPTWSIPSPANAVPGRKFYVHHNGWQSVKNGKDPGTREDIKQTQNNCTVEPLDGGNLFDFEIFFENLEPYELGLLIYSLQLEEGLAHKLGKGKSLGFGSVDITVQNVTLRTHAGEWENGNTKVNEWIGEGKKKINGWFGKEWEENRHINDLWKLLHFPKGKSINVFYPPLRQKDLAESDLPGYEELKKRFKEQGEKNREDLLTNPWTPWHLPKKE